MKKHNHKFVYDSTASSNISHNQNRVTTSYDNNTTGYFNHNTYDNNTTGYFNHNTIDVFPDQDLVVSHNGKKIKVGETLEKILDRLCILVPDYEKMEKYPALREAYEAYQLIDKMISDNADQK
jgi:hypothetical protein